LPYILSDDIVGANVTEIWPSQKLFFGVFQNIKEQSRNARAKKLAGGDGAAGAGTDRM
jgi:hypothetical protein